jgi:hydrogenase nickel incorporation protein HypA/HybF
MDEVGIAGAILEAVERRAGGRPVRRVRIRAGVLLHISESALNQAFVMISDGTVADGAHIDLVVEPVRFVCRSCGRASTSDRMPAACHECGGTDLEPRSGDALVLESVTLAEPGRPHQAAHGDLAGPGDRT